MQMDPTLDNRLHRLEAALTELQGSVKELETQVFGVPRTDEIRPIATHLVAESATSDDELSHPPIIPRPIGDVRTFPGMAQTFMPPMESPPQPPAVEQIQPPQPHMLTPEIIRPAGVYRVQREDNARALVLPPPPPRHEPVLAGATVAQRYPSLNPRFAPPKRSFSFNPQSLIATLSRTEFWLNKVGIVLFLFGVAFLFKYAIDKQWITEEARLGAGVLLGSIVLTFGLRLHANRRHFSQVLMGGAIATYYITGYAAYNIFPDLHIPYEAAFAFMALATVLAFGLSLWGDDVSLSLIGAAGGLLTPFVLNTNAIHLPFLMGYTCLLLAGTSAIYIYRGWRSLLWTTVAGGWVVSLFGLYAGIVLGRFNTDAPENLASRVAVQAGLVAMLLAFWAVPVLHEVLWHRNPARYRRPSLDFLDDASLKNIHTYLLSACVPFVSLIFSVGVWLSASPTKEVWGWVALGGAGVFALVGYLVKHANARLAYLHALVAIGLLNIGLVLILQGNALIFALALEAVCLHLISFRYKDVGMEVCGTLVFGAVGLWMVSRLLQGGDQPVIFNLQALTDLAVLGLALGSSFFVSRVELRLAYRGFFHVAALAWLWRELHGLPNGDGYVMLAWAAYGILLHLAARKLSGDSLDAKGTIIAAHLAFEGALGVLAYRMATGYSGSPLFNQKAATDLVVMGMALVTSFLVSGKRAAAVYRLLVHAAVLAWLWREATYTDFVSGYVMLRWAAYVAAVAFISHRLRDRVTLIAAAVPFPVIAMLFIWHITLGRLSYLLYLNSDTLIDLTVLMLVLAVSFVAQPERVKLCLRLTFHAGMLAWFWRVLPGNYDLVYMMVAWAAYATLLQMVYRLTGHRIALWVGHVVAGVVGTWLIGHIIYGLLTTNPAATPIFNPQGLADLGIIVLAALMYWPLRSDRQLSLIYGLWLHLAVLGWTWQELGLYPNGNGYVTIAWGLYALGLIAAALRLDRNRVLMLCGLSTLFAVAAKLFLIDLRYVDAIWRILLFLGFGGLFLLVSYFFQNVVRRAEGSG